MRSGAATTFKSFKRRGANIECNVTLVFWRLIYMFGIGVPELILILIIGLVVFGPGKLPGVGKALGQSIKEFKQANSDDKTIDVTEQKKLDAEKK